MTRQNKQDIINAQMVALWNHKHPIGTAVVVTKDDKTEINSKTESEAYILSGHTPVVHIEGISGCYLLSRVRADSCAI